jgi:hypothetical protein
VAASLQQVGIHVIFVFTPFKMLMMLSKVSRLAGVLAVVLHMSPAQAQSGAGCSAMNDPWIHTVAYGTKSDLDRLSKQILAKPRKSFFLERWWEYFDRNTAARRDGVWKEKQRDALLRYADCGAVPLHYAVKFGNIEAVEWLLDHGANPAGPVFVGSGSQLIDGQWVETTRPTGENLYTRCDTVGIPWDRTNVNAQHSRLQAFALTVRRGGSPNAPLGTGRHGEPLTALDSCNDVAVLSVLVKNSPDVPASSLRYAVSQALDYRGGLRFSIDRVRQLVLDGVKPDGLLLQRLAEPNCRIPEIFSGDNAGNCRDLQKLFHVQESKLRQRISTAASTRG